MQKPKAHPISWPTSERLRRDSADPESRAPERERTGGALRPTEELAVARRLTGSIGHEIKNALESITNIVYFLERDSGLNESSRHSLLIVHEQIDRLTHAANLLLGFCRQSYRPAVVRLSALLEDTLRLYASNIRRKRLVIEKQYVSNDSLQGFAPELRQVFSNLIMNAIQVLNEDGKITLRVSVRTQWRGMETVSVLIADNGPGIAPEHRENIFKPFFTTKTRGTGLGLWLTRRIVEEHGGSIRVRSRVLPGQSGTVFQVCLPSSPSQQVKLSSDPEMSGQAA